jgi:Flp pilus assembly protein TadD
MLSGCALGQQKPQSAFGAKADLGKVGLGIRAQAALESQQFSTAVELAEQAVAGTPNDAGYRALLANCYFAAGRFASAEQAYRDSLTLMPNQPQLVLKLALVEIAQGRDVDAVAALNEARPTLDPADYGLAMALAGHPDEAVAVLDEVARSNGADARVRQNLALAYGLSGDWTMARTVAAQDVPADQLDGRIQQWMSVATPTHPSDQVAMLTGVHPSADPGQPQALALNALSANQQMAQLDLPKTAAVPQPVQPQPAEVPAVAPPALPDPEPSAAAAAPMQPPIEESPAPVVATLIAPPSSAEAPVVPAVAAQPAPTRFDTPVEPAKYVAITDTVRKAAAEAHRSNGKSSSVVQLGAYSSPDRVSVAWNWITKRFPALGSYTPMRARYDGPKGTVWRLSIKGFDSDREARDRCEMLQSRGGKCFVRRTAGDSPVQFASR